MQITQTFYTKITWMVKMA